MSFRSVLASLFVLPSRRERDYVRKVWRDEMHRNANEATVAIAQARVSKKSAERQTEKIAKAEAEALTLGEMAQAVLDAVSKKRGENGCI